MAGPQETAGAGGPSGHDQFVDDVIGGLGLPSTIVDAFRAVDRAEFVPEDKLDWAYKDAIAGVKDGSSVSQPSLVAVMIYLLDVKPADKVLEIGTALGYQAAILSQLAGEVHTIEYDEELVETATERLARLGYDKVTTHLGDGAAGVPDEAPFDKIILTAGVRSLPPKLTDQLAVGGMILAPAGHDPDNLRLVQAVKLESGEFESRTVWDCHFVPLMSQEEGGWTTEALAALKESKLKRLAEVRQNFKTMLQGQCETANKTYETTINDIASTLNEIFRLHFGGFVDMNEDFVLDTTQAIMVSMPRQRPTEEA